MALDTKYRDWNGQEQSIQSWMDNVDRRIASLHHVMLAPGAEPSRIPGDPNRTNLRDAIMDTTAKVVEIQREVGRPAPLPEPLPTDALAPPPSAGTAQPEQQNPPPEPERQPEQRRTPARNITAGALAGAAGTVAAWISSLYGVTLPEPVSAAVVLLLTAVTAWLVPPDQRSSKNA